MLQYLQSRVWIWANQPIHSFLVGYLNPCLQGATVHASSPQPRVCVCVCVSLLGASVAEFRYGKHK
jgi:hypothetical protein